MIRKRREESLNQTRFLFNRFKIMENTVKNKSDDLAFWVQEITKEKEGRDISYEEAREGADNFVGFFDLLYKIDQRNNRKNKF